MVRHRGYRPGTKAVFVRDLRAAYPSISSSRPEIDGKRVHVLHGISLTLEETPDTPDGETTARGQSGVGDNADSAQPRAPSGMSGVDHSVSSQEASANGIPGDPGYPSWLSEEIRAGRLTPKEGQERLAEHKRMSGAEPGVRARRAGEPSLDDVFVIEVIAAMSEGILERPCAYVTDIPWMEFNQHGLPYCSLCGSTTYRDEYRSGKTRVSEHLPELLDSKRLQDRARRHPCRGRGDHAPAADRADRGAAEGVRPTLRRCRLPRVEDVREDGSTIVNRGGQRLDPLDKDSSGPAPLYPSGV